MNQLHARRVVIQADDLRRVAIGGGRGNSDNSGNNGDNELEHGGDSVGCCESDYRKGL